MRKPAAYQEVDRERTEVFSGYVIEDRSVGIRRAYDTTRTLVVDPGLEFYAHFGGSYGNGEQGIAVDASGNTYVSGYTNGPDYPATTTSLQPTTPGVYETDCVVVKLDPAGQPVYNTYTGGTSADVATAIAVDSSGNAYVTGYTYSADFPTVNAFQRHFAGPSGTATSVVDPRLDRWAPLPGRDAFVGKLNAAGSGLTYSTFLGGGSSGSGKAIALDSAGSAYVTGTTFSPDFQSQRAFSSLCCMEPATSL